jgi:hypothetical protein
MELSNRILAALVLVTLVAAIGGTYAAYVNAPRSSQFFSITGYATEGSGNVTLTINSTLAIEVDELNNIINFGTCSPRPGISYWCATNDSDVCSGDNAAGNCSGDTTTPQYLQVNNVGNVHAAIGVTSSCTAATLIGGTNPNFAFVTTHCNSTDVSSWLSLTTGSQSACTNLSYQGGALRFYVNVTIPNDAIGSTGACGATNRSVITFIGTPA